MVRKVGYAMNKLKSVKFWFTLVCLGLLAFIILTSKTEFQAVALALVGIVGAYLAANTVQKKIFTDAAKEVKEMINGK